jgi:cell division protein ZapD
MVNHAAELPEQSAEPLHMEFEQPLNERMRTFLKIEALYQQALFHIEDTTDFGARAAVSSLLDIVAILGRGDIRADVLKELERHSELLGQYRRQQGVDLARLQSLIANIADLKGQLTEAGPHFMNAIKDCEFLNAIKHRSSIPAGTCMFDLPDYSYWLRRPYSERAAQFSIWTCALRPVCDAIAELLWLTRETNDPSEQIAVGGMYQHTLDRNESFNLVRVTLPADCGLYPEISAGQHRFTVRFVRWQGVDQRPVQAGQSVHFMLALC